MATYVRVYQDRCCTRKVGGLMGELLILNFWKHKINNVIVNNYEKPILLNGYESSIKRIFPEVKEDPKLVYTKLSDETNPIYYDGLIYLVKIKKTKNYRKILEIHIADYTEGKLNSLSYLEPTKMVLYPKDDFGFVKVERLASTIYDVEVCMHDYIDRPSYELKSHKVID